MTSEFIRDWCPPVLLRKWESIVARGGARSSTVAAGNSFAGNYSTWKDALRDSTGYDAQGILDRTLESTLKVKNGEAVFERDSVLLEKPEYPYFLIACLLSIALENDRKLSVLDFGGALGSSYYQCRRFLAGMQRLHWTVVEQGKHVDYGKRYMEDDVLRFHYNIDEAVKIEKPDVLVLSGVLNVIEDPYELIRSIIMHEIGHVIVDRQPLTSRETERLTVMTVTPEIYTARFPCWFLSERKFREAWLGDYELQAESEGSPLIVDGDVMPRKQFYFSHRK